MYIYRLHSYRWRHTRFNAYFIFICIYIYLLVFFFRVPPALLSGFDSAALCPTVKYP